MDIHIPLQAIKGRGTPRRLTHRFASEDRQAFDDGWGSLPEALAEAPAPRTRWVWEPARSAMAFNTSDDIGFDRSLNPYRGCEHGCSYCYARPSHSYLGLSPGLDFETRLVAKQGLAERLREELSRPAYRPAVLAIGTVTDCYQPVERELKITRSLIEVLRGYRGTPEELLARSERFVGTVAPISGRYQRPVEYADLRHHEGYALRLKGVSTTLTAAEKKTPGN